MLQPKSYPEMLGKALVLEEGPFIEMVEDDNPWAEGLTLVISVGVLVGAARVVGSMLTSAILPHPDALLTALLQIWNEFEAIFGTSLAAGVDVDSALHAWLPMGASLFGVGWSPMQLVWIVAAPFILVVQWLSYGLITHVAARAMGGGGKLAQTLGAVALMVAPQLLVLLKVIPFVSVSNLLLWFWAMLLVYRATEVTHGLSWRKSALATVAAPALLLLLTVGGLIILSVFSIIAGGAA